MPLLKLQTNVDVAQDTAKGLMAEVSRLLSEALGKPEGYIMVGVEGGRSMIFAGNAEPLAYLELKSIGLPADKVPMLSRTLCTFLEDRLGIPKDRVYIEFADAPRSMWGWNGATF